MVIFANMKRLLQFCLLSALTLPNYASAQDSLSAEVLNAFSFRNIGPATTGGRISDIAVNPKNHSEYYVATAYGGIWKTDNSGNTFSPIFDNYGTQSIGCMSLRQQMI